MEKRIAASALLASLLLADAAVAAVKVQEKTEAKFGGLIGAMAGAMGGGANAPTLSTVAVLGDRKLSLSAMSGEIIDLQEEKVYRLDPRNKTYTVLSFAAIRKQMEDARARMQGKKPQAEPPAAAAPGKDPNVEVDYDVKDTGQAKAINGFDAKQMVLTISVRQKGKTLEQGGGMVMRSDMWMSDALGARKEVADFDRRYAQKLYGGADLGAALASMGQMASAAMMNPGIGPAMAKLRAETDKMHGSPVLTTTTMESVRNPEQPAGGDAAAAGGFAALLAQKMKKGGGGGGDEARSVLMTTTHEVLSVSSQVTPQDVALPAGYTAK